MFDIQFQGAARTTTGSMHIVDVNGLRILLDCGLYQGHRKEAFERNRQLAVDAASVDCVLLSHAHIDHSGNLPSLVRAGYHGSIYTTEATRDLCNPMLRDCAYITNHDVEIVNRRRKAEGKRLFEPLYSEQDVERTLAQMQGVPYKRAIDLGHGVSAVFHNAGHILGSALVELLARQPNGTFRRLLFSGDLGQPGQPIIRPMWWKEQIFCSWNRPMPTATIRRARTSPGACVTMCRILPSSMPSLSFPPSALAAHSKSSFS